MKKAFKQFMKGSKKVELPPEPRDMKTLNEQYSLLCGSLGQAQYKAKVLEADIAELLNRIVGIDKEAKARQALDTEAAKTQSEAKNEQA